MRGPMSIIYKGERVMGPMIRDTKRITEIDGFVGRCAAGLEAYYVSLGESGRIDPGSAFRAGLRQVTRMLAVLVASERVPAGDAWIESVSAASEALFDALAGGDGWIEAYTQACDEACAVFGHGNLRGFRRRRVLHGGSFEPWREGCFGPPTRRSAACTFETMPLNWLGSAYQALLALKPSKSGAALQASYRRRKEDGVYFTPPYLVEYIVESALGARAEDILGRTRRTSATSKRLARLRVLDPSDGRRRFPVRHDRLSGQKDRRRGGDRTSSGQGWPPSAYTAWMSILSWWRSRRFASGGPRGLPTASPIR